jgi:hypothetical protein
MRFSGAILLCLGAASLTPCLADPPDSTAVATSQPATPPAPAPSSPASPAAPAAPTTSQSATPAAPTAPSSPAVSAASAAKAAPATATADEKHVADKDLLAAGYSPEMHNGTKVWCRREQELGSRLGGHKTCGTAEELNFIQQETRERLEMTQRDSVYPQSGGK